MQFFIKLDVYKSIQLPICENTLYTPLRVVRSLKQ